MFFSKAWKVEGTSCWKSSTFHSLPTWSEWKILMICVWRRKEGMSCTWHPFFEVSLIIFNDEPISFLVGGGALIIWNGSSLNLQSVQMNPERLHMHLFVLCILSFSPKTLCGFARCKNSCSYSPWLQVFGQHWIAPRFWTLKFATKNEHEKRDKKKIIPS